VLSGGHRVPPPVETRHLRLEGAYHRFFSDRLLGSLGEAWRAYSHFRDIVYLDIETTGLSPTSDKITLVGVSDGQTYTVFVAGQNLAELPAYLARFRVITTFNGAGFDLRFLRAAFPDLASPRSTSISVASRASSA